MKIARHTSVALCAAGIFALSGCGESPPAETRELRLIEAEPILRVEAVDLSVTEGPSGPGVVVQATGMAPTGGWTDLKLVQSEDRPEDEILTLLFVGTPPEGMATQALTEVQAQTSVYALADWVVSVQVVAEENSIQKPMPADAVVPTPETDPR